jgi:hypothetical protein
VLILRGTRTRVDFRIQEGDRRLRQDTAVDRGTLNHVNGRLGQDDALHLRIFANRDRSGHLPEDVLPHRTARESNIGEISELNTSRRLKDEDLTGAAVQLETAVVDEYVSVKFVDTGRQSLAAELAFSLIEVGRIAGTSGGVDVRGYHVEDRGGQITGSGFAVVRRIGATLELLGATNILVS